jgi:hypothetical protein
MASKLGLPGLPGPACPQRDLALALIVSRVAAPASKLSALAWWSGTTAGPDLGIEAAATDDVSAAMDWLQARAGGDRGQARPPASVTGGQPAGDRAVRPVQLVAGGHALPARAAGLFPRRHEGQGADRVRLLTDPQARPVAIRVFEGNTADPAAFTEITEVVRNGLGLRKMVMAGGRGMITTARIEALQELNEHYGWITAPRSPQIRKLMAGDGPLQLSLFDEQAGLPRRAPGRAPGQGPAAATGGAGPLL